MATKTNNVQQPTTFATAQQALKRLRDELHDALADPALDDGQKQRCLDAYNAANSEFQRLIATQIKDLGKAYTIDEDSAQSLAKPLRDLKKSLDTIKVAAQQVQWVLDAITDVLKILAPFLI